MVLYYVPGRPHVDARHYEELGFGHLIGTAAKCREIVGAGPDGQRGVVFTPAELGTDVNMGPVGYYPDRQTWRRFSGVDETDGSRRELWFGWDERPGPADFVRRDVCDGYPVRLADGHEWQVVIARVFPRGTKLPITFGLGADGAMVERVRSAYEDVVEDARRVYMGEDLTYADGLRIAARALGVNYRVSLMECLALELFGLGEVERCLESLVDQPALDRALAEMEAQKKTGTEGG